MFGWSEEKQFIVLILAGLLISGSAFAVNYALVGGEVVETKSVNAPELALSLGGEITSLNAQAETAQGSYESELSRAEAVKEGIDYLQSKHPIAAEELTYAYDTIIEKANTYLGEAVYYEEQAAIKQAELTALNQVFTPSITPTKPPFGG